MKKVIPLVALVALLCVTSGPQSAHAQGPPVTDAGTIMLSQPATSADHIAFTYAGDLWVALHDGSDIRRLTTHVGQEANPRFSPDGRTLAFSGQYDGNIDVFVVPVQGGVPERLTWHPGSDIVQGFTVDGQAVLFTSSRSTYTGRHRQLFTVSLAGGHPDQLLIPHAFKATYSPLNASVRPSGENRGFVSSPTWVVRRRISLPSWRATHRSPAYVNAM